jgi:hypothetical protein
MSVPRYVLTFAGLITIASSLLGYLYSRNWLFVTMFVGLNLVQFSVTSVCPLTFIVDKIKGRKSGGGCCCNGK